MNDDFMFEDEVDEEAAAELERQRAGGSTFEYRYVDEDNKKRGTSKATASMVLGIISLVFFCSFINVITAIIAIILGIVYLVNYDLSEGKGRAIVGITTAAVSVFLLFSSLSYMTSNVNLINLMDDEMFQFYYEYDGGIDDVFDIDNTL